MSRQTMHIASSLRTDLESGLAVRRACRAGEWRGTTAGLAKGFVQGNLVVLPAGVAEEFLEFCRRNPKPCPVIGCSEPGDARIPGLGDDLDIRTDLPRYRIWKKGELVAEATDIRDAWRADSVAIVLGCSFSFEEALLAAGVTLRHIAEGRNVAMYRTSIDCVPAGRFAGPLVVSMRPLRPADAIRAVEITARFPAVHGAPVHIGLPHLIGIDDLTTPDYGDAIEVRGDELPVFWACGVTPQAVIAAAKPDFAITHAPGAMLVTDLLNAQLVTRERTFAGGEGP
jgi:uncharacterized protein YcsI (UPF0317 family)